jgi:hypothetical protein
MLVGLTFFHSTIIMTNRTTLDTLKGSTVDCPCVPERDYAKGKGLLYSSGQINLFDRGCLANTAHFFSKHRYLFWWPFVNYTDNDGTSYPLIRKVTTEDTIPFIIGNGANLHPPREGSVDEKLIIQALHEEL